MPPQWTIVHFCIGLGSPAGTLINRNKSLLDQYLILLAICDLQCACESFIMISAKRSVSRLASENELVAHHMFSCPSPFPLPLFSIPQAKTYTIIGGRSSEIPTVFRVAGVDPSLHRFGLPF